MSMFAKAKTVAQKPAAKSKKEKAEFEIAGMEKYAAIDALIKQLTALKETEESEIKPQIIDKYIELGKSLGACPETFNGVEGDATGSCQLRRRSTNSPLKDEEIAILDQNGIGYDCVDIVMDTFVINPVYATDEKLLEKVSKALEKVKDIPEDFIMKQEGKKKYVVGENCLNQAFKLGDNAMRTVLEIVGVPAIRAKLNSADLLAPYKIVLGMMNMEVSPKAAKKAAK